MGLPSYFGIQAHFLLLLAVSFSGIIGWLSVVCGITSYAFHKENASSSIPRVRVSLPIFAEPQADKISKALMTNQIIRPKDISASTASCEILLLKNITKVLFLISRAHTTNLQGGYPHKRLCPLPLPLAIVSPENLYPTWLTKYDTLCPTLVECPTLSKIFITRRSAHSFLTLLTVSPQSVTPSVCISSQQMD